MSKKTELENGWIRVTRKKRKVKSDQTALPQLPGYDPVEALRPAKKISDVIIRIPITKEFCDALQHARNGMGYTRAQLAYIIREKEALVENYEKGYGSADFAIIRKINKALGITLPKLSTQKLEI